LSRNKKFEAKNSSFQKKLEAKLEKRSVERGICPIATLRIRGVGANRAQLSFTGAEL